MAGPSRFVIGPSCKYAQQGADGVTRHVLDVTFVKYLRLSTQGQQTRVQKGHLDAHLATTVVSDKHQKPDPE